MPSPSAIVFQDPAGNPLAGGTATFRLSTDAMSPSGQISAGRVVTATLDENGTATVSLWNNTLLNPPNTVYFVEAFTAEGQPAWSGEITIDTVSVVTQTNGNLGFVPNPIQTESSGWTGTSLIVAACYVTDGTTVTVTDSNSNTYTLVSTNVSGTNSLQLFYAWAPVITDTMTFSITGSDIADDSDCLFQIVGFSSIQTEGDPFEAGSSVTNTSSPTSVTSLQIGAVSPDNAGDLIIAASTFGGGVGLNFTIDSGFNQSESVTIAFLVAPNTDSVNPTLSATYPPTSVIFGSLAIFSHA
jgi:hypothetical protein